MSSNGLSKLESRDTGVLSVFPFFRLVHLTNDLSTRVETLFNIISGPACARSTALFSALVVEVASLWLSLLLEFGKVIEVNWELSFFFALDDRDIFFGRHCPHKDRVRCE